MQSDSQQCNTDERQFHNPTYDGTNGTAPSRGSTADTSRHEEVVSSPPEYDAVTVNAASPMLTRTGQSYDILCRDKVNGNRSDKYVYIV